MGCAQLYVAQTVPGTISVYRIDPASGALNFLHAIPTGTGVDNIDLDPDSDDLYVGSHFRKLTFLNHAIRNVPKCTCTRTKRDGMRR